MPFEDRLGFDDGNRVRHQFAEGDGFRREGASLVVGQENTAVDLVAQDAVLPEQVLDSAQQVFIHTSGDVGQHSFPRHGAFLAAMLAEDIQWGRVI